MGKYFKGIENSRKLKVLFEGRRMETYIKTGLAMGIIS
jgi:hypothetical protein